MNRPQCRILESRPRRAFTLIELLIAFTVFSGVALGIMAIFRHVGLESAKSMAHSGLTLEANNVVKFIQNDIEQAASLTLALKADMSETVVRQYRGSIDDMAEVKYIWQKPRLWRRVLFKGKTESAVLSAHLDHFKLERKPRPSPDGKFVAGEMEQVLIEVAFKSDVPGLEQPVTHEQHAMVTQRELASQKYDPNWHNVGNISGFFKGYGSLMTSLAHDASLMVEDMTSRFADLAAEVDKAKNEADPVRRLNEIKSRMLEMKADMTTRFGDLQTSITNLDKEAILKFEHRPFLSLFEATKKKNRAAQAMKDALLAMTKPADFDYGRITAASRGYDIQDGIEAMFKSKKKFVEEQGKIDGNIAAIDEQINKLGGG